MLRILALLFVLHTTIFQGQSANIYIVLNVDEANTGMKSLSKTDSNYGLRAREAPPVKKSDRESIKSKLLKDITGWRESNSNTWLQHYTEYIEEMLKNVSDAKIDRLIKEMEKYTLKEDLHHLEAMKDIHSKINFEKPTWEDYWEF